MCINILTASSELKWPLKWPMGRSICFAGSSGIQLLNINGRISFPPLLLVVVVAVAFPQSLPPSPLPLDRKWFCVGKGKVKASQKKGSPFIFLSLSLLQFLPIFHLSSSVLVIVAQLMPMEPLPLILPSKCSAPEWPRYRAR